MNDQSLLGRHEVSSLYSLVQVFQELQYMKKIGSLVNKCFHVRIGAKLVCVDVEPVLEVFPEFSASEVSELHGRSGEGLCWQDAEIVRFMSCSRETIKFQGSSSLVKLDSQPSSQ